MGDSLSHAGPVASINQYPRPSGQDLTKRHSASQPEEDAESHAPEQDGVELHSGATLARQLLRERVLSRTRERLELMPGEFVPSFVENVEEEPVGVFLGRLIGAQNQLAALRVRQLSQGEIRSRLDSALRDGVAEAMEMVAPDPRDGAVGCEFVADVLADYGRRIAELALSDD